MIFQSPIKHQSVLSESGFGLLAVVFLILTISIGAITFMTVINPSALTRKNRETTDKAVILRAAIQSYQYSHGGISGTNPPTLDSLVTTDGVQCLVNNTPTQVTYLSVQGWCGPYVDQVVTQDLNDFKIDGWGTLFSYVVGTSVFTSCGPNKTCGDADDITFNP